MSLKDIMGTAFKEEITVPEIIAFFEGNTKIVNLSNGGYVAKEKFDDLNTKHQTLVNDTKDYQEVKSKYQALIEKQEKDNHLAMIKKYVKPEFSEFAYYNLKQSGLVNDKFEDNIKDYAKTNSQYAIEIEKKQNNRVINTFVDTNNGTAPDNKSNNPNQTMNDMIRSAAGK